MTIIIIRLVMVNRMRKFLHQLLVRFHVWRLAAHGWYVRRSVEGSRLEALGNSFQPPTFSLEPPAAYRSQGGQGAIEYIILLATLSLLILFKEEFIQKKVLDVVNETFAIAVGKMVPP